MERRTLERTTASRIKCLYLAVLDAGGADAARAFLERSGIQEDLLLDETRPVPTELWHRALAEFERTCDGKALDETARFFAHPDNLAVWTAVLRSAAEPAQAFQQLGQLGLDQGDEESVSGWKTVAASAFSWHGKAPLPPRREDADRVARARVAELRALLLLFGAELTRSHFVHVPEERTTHFEVSWSFPWSRIPAGGALLGGGAGAGVALVAGGSGWIPALGANLGTLAGLDLLGVGVLGLGPVGLGLVGFAAGTLGSHEAQRRARAQSQAYRIQALERSAQLRSRRDASGTMFCSGTLIAGQFRLRRSIGLGAAGSVWEAERLADGRLVALKVLRTAVAHDSQAADRLRREADALGLAWHPNVVEVLDHGHLPTGVAYLVMELLAGESLAQRLERGQPLRPTELWELALQACDALDAVHAAGVVHRDIKPSNLFLTEDGEGRLRLKLVDFGIAQVAWAETRLTRSGTPLGTPGYMAPEQEAGRLVDGRSDLFSLGGVLYEVLVGKPPPIPPLEGGLPAVWVDFEEVPAPWRPILERLLAPLPNQRFSDARSLRQALRELPDPARARAEITRDSA